MAVSSAMPFFLFLFVFDYASGGFLMGRFKCSSASCGKLSTIFRFDLAAKLERFKVAYRQVSRRILRMNKRLDKEFGEHVAKKRGWALGAHKLCCRSLG